MFIIALWEEIVNREYIQTRLQTDWGFWGVIVTSLLFAFMHIPSALFLYDNDIVKAFLRFVESGLAGLGFGYIYWYTGSVLSTIAIHGLNNLATDMLRLYTNGTTQPLIFTQPVFILSWIGMQVIVVIFLCRVLFKDRMVARLDEKDSDSIYL